MFLVDWIPTFLYSLLAFVGISALYLIYQYTVGVYLRVRFYKKQGGVGYYGFGSQLYKDLEEDAIKHGDSYYSILKTQKKNPGMRFFVRNVGKKPLVILTDPLLVKQFLLKAELYRKYDIELFEGVSTRSTLLSEGEEWKISRKSIAPKFAFDNLNNAIPVIIESTLENFDQWDRENKFNHLAVGMFHDITGEVILRHWFGTSHLKNRWQGKHTLTDLIKFFLDDYGTASSSYTFTILGHHIVNLGLQDSHRRFLKRKEELRNYGKQLLKDAMQKGVGDHTLLSVLMKEKENDTKFYDDEKILNEFLDLLIAGADSISHMLGFTLYYLSKHPEKLEKIKEEIEREFSDVSNISILNINRMEYTYAALKETLRLAPEGAFTITREVIQDHCIEGLSLKSGDLVNFVSQTFHMSEEYYSNPEEYCPERWLPNGAYPNDGWKKEPYSFLTFFAGPRNCVGQQLAMIEGRILLSLFLKRYDYKVPSNYELKKVQSFSYIPLDPFYIDIKPRN